MKFRKLFLVGVLAHAALVGCTKGKSGYTGKQPGNTASRSGYTGKHNPESVTAVKQVVQNSSDALLMPIETVKNSLGMDMVLVPAGKFMMGSPESEKNRKEGEFQREVVVEKQFYISAHEVTQKQYAVVMQENPSGFVSANRPVENVTWNNAMEFCRRLSELEDATYRLPTEEEWEYACRAGTTTPFHYGSEMTSANGLFDSRYPYGSKVKGPQPASTKPVGSYKPNSLGLYDMHGNVYEWCLNRLVDSRDAHVIRGGSGFAAAHYARSAYRSSSSTKGWQWLGFRVVKSKDREEYEIPNAFPLDRVDNLTSSEMTGRVDAAFDQTAEELLPPVVIFPVVDNDAKVTAEGVGMGELAAYAASHWPKRRMAIGVTRVRYVFHKAGCYQYDPGVVLDAETIRVCMAALDAKYYVLPQLVKGENTWKLKVSFHVIPDNTKDDVSNAASEIEETLNVDTATEVPGVIAKNVLKYLDAGLNDSELKTVQSPKVQTAGDVAELGKFIADEYYGENSQQLREFLDRNPQSLAAWGLFLRAEIPLGDAQAYWESKGKPVEHELVEIALVEQTPPKSFTQHHFLDLLELAPSYRTDSYYFYALHFVSTRLGNSDLSTHVMEKWRKIDTSNTGKYLRGAGLIDSAWKARGGGWGKDVSDEGSRLFQERLQMARKEFEDAIEMNPLSWESHARLITVAQGLGLPREYARKHFEAAKKIRPLDRMAYDNMFGLVRLNWGGTPDELLTLAHESLDVGNWDTHIPDVAINVVRDLTTVPGAYGQIRKLYAHPQIWKIVERYYKGAIASGREGDIKYAKSYFARAGGYGKKFNEVASVYQALDKEGIDERVFDNDFTYDYLRDRTYGAAGEGQTQIVARVRSALDDADFDEAEKQIALLEPASQKDREESERLKRVVQIGQQLNVNRKITLTGSQITESFYGIDENWSASGGDLLWKGKPESEALIIFPFGLKNARISVMARWAGSLQRVRVYLHTRSNRDHIVLDYQIQPYGEVFLKRSNVPLMSGRVVNSDTDIQFVFGADEDTLKPAPHINWTMPVYEDEPSGFAIELLAHKRGALVSFNKLQIELLDK